jgi:hypothetical protein
MENDARATPFERRMRAFVHVDIAASVAQPKGSTQPAQRATHHNDMHDAPGR